MRPAPQRRPHASLQKMNLRLVDFLARLRLTTGARVVRAPRELWELLELCGLAEAVGQPEQREEPRRVEKERELDDPTV